MIPRKEIGRTRDGDSWWYNMRELWVLRGNEWWLRCGRRQPVIIFILHYSISIWSRWGHSRTNWPLKYVQVNVFVNAMCACCAHIPMGRIRRCTATELVFRDLHAMIFTLTIRLIGLKCRWNVTPESSAEFKRSICLTGAMVSEELRSQLSEWWLGSTRNFWDTPSEGNIERTYFLVVGLAISAIPLQPWLELGWYDK